MGGLDARTDVAQPSDASTAVGQVGQDVVVIKRFTMVRVEGGSGATNENGIGDKFLEAGCRTQNSLH
jgi:hypothetical protein